MYKKIWFLILIVGIVFISGCISGKIISKPTQLEFGKPVVVDDVSITFNSVRFADKVGTSTADNGYKFAIIDITAKNVGFEKKYFPFDSWDMEIKVDKGYKYEYHYSSKEPSSMKPEDIETGYIVFEILDDTYPIELYIDDWEHGKYILPISQKNYLTSSQTEFKTTNIPISESKVTSRQIEYMKVLTVIDGDTIELENKQNVRLIGINAPEAGKTCYSEAKSKLEDLTKGKIVKLEKDVDDKDQYGRLLRYVYVDDTFVNLEMVRLGLAHKYEYGSNTKYSTLFEQAENEAKQNEGCLWKTEEINYIQDQCIYITNFHFNAAGNDNYNLNDEYVTFGNRCSYSIDMTGWTIKDETASHIYILPPFTFNAGATFTLYTGTGTNTNSALYWGRTSGNYAAIWNNNGDTLFLRDSNGNLVLTQSYSGY